MALYSKAAYWDQRYSNVDNEPHDWYQDYRGLRHLLNPTSFAAQSSKSSKQQQSTGGSFPSRDECSTLILGCGNSSFGEDMLRDGWTGKIVNVDFSSVVIEQMESKYDDAFYEGLWPGKDSATVNKMEYVCADMTQELPFSDESFDLIVCKGSFDAILCSAGSVANIRFLTEECARLLTARGVFFLVTHGNPDSRIVFLEYQNNIHYYWEGVNIQSVPRPLTQKTDHVYVCSRRLDLPGHLFSENKAMPLSLPTENDVSFVTAPKATMERSLSD